jgi:hypothetical protein
VSGKPDHHALPPNSLLVLEVGSGTPGAAQRSGRPDLGPACQPMCRFVGSMSLETCTATVACGGWYVDWQTHN